MHGMLSSAIILAAFALVAGVGGYIALWLYRAAPGAPSRSRPREFGPHDEAPEFGPHDEAPEFGPHDEAPEFGSHDEAVDFEPPEETAGAGLYLLHEPRLPRR